jgi:hypothetical protein
LFWLLCPYQCSSFVGSLEKLLDHNIKVEQCYRSPNQREAIVEQLISSDIIRIDSLSDCLHNAEPPPGVSLWAPKEDILRHYLFYLAFENQNVPDYITEKLWQPFQAGTVPVYLGAPNVDHHVPDHSMINVNDFKNDTLSLARYLHKVANDKELYESYQTWRHKPLPLHFVAKYNFTHIHSTCRTCRWAFARMYGVGWSHTNQSIRELHIPRNPCVNKDGLLSKPFQGTWSTMAGDDNNNKAASIETTGQNDNVAASCDLDGPVVPSFLVQRIAYHEQ